VALSKDIVECLVAAAGWAGAALFVTAYGLLSRGRLHGSSRVYHGLNIAGGVGLAICNGSHGAFPSATVNLVWICIGVHTMLLRYRRG
jgi:hypothetical protein